MQRLKEAENMNLNDYIGEATAYDKKLMLCCVGSHRNPLTDTFVYTPMLALAATRKGDVE